MTLIFTKFRCLLWACVVVPFLAACAPLAVPPQTEYPVGRGRLILPPGHWQDLGTSAAAAGPVALQERAVGLRGDQGQWLAVLLVQTNLTGEFRGSAPISGYCPPQKDVLVDDESSGSPLRADCLRFKRWASSDQWLEKNRPDLVRWLGERRVAMPQPHSHVNYRYATDGGAVVLVDALVDQRLLSPKTNNNSEFLTAGRPALQWGQDLAQAVRVSAGMVDGYLALPPFPFPAPGRP